jgi:hypothetical protein
MAATAEARYAALPASIRAIYSYDEWVWLTDQQKDRLELAETEPEWDQ